MPVKTVYVQCANARCHHCAVQHTSSLPPLHLCKQQDENPTSPLKHPSHASQARGVVEHAPFRTVTRSDCHHLRAQPRQKRAVLRLPPLKHGAKGPRCKPNPWFISNGETVRRPGQPHLPLDLPPRNRSPYLLRVLCRSTARPSLQHHKGKRRHAVHRACSIPRISIGPLVWTFEKEGWTHQRPGLVP